jgi:molybdopterin converting factor small subunit
MNIPNKYQQIETFALRVITQCGSDASERENPGSKAKTQAAVIAEGIRQYDEANDAIKDFDHITIILQ